MTTKTNTLEKNSNSKVKPLKSVWSRAVTGNSEWPDKEEFLDVIYWSRQITAIFMGVFWGILPLKGFVGLGLFTAINSGIVYLYSMKFQSVDEENYGGIWELLKEGFMTSLAGFLVTWIIFYSGLHFESL